METTNGNNVKKYFLLPKSLFQQAEKISNELGLNFSELLRDALENYVLQKEKEKTDKEIAEACKYYYNIDEEVASEWRAAEGKI
jgi:metal-responsive CopG/Arc/MetJ family transcriptional regulator